MRSHITWTLLLTSLVLTTASVVQAEEFLVEDEFDSEDMFSDDAFTDEDTDALLAQAPYELWWQHGLVYDPSSFTRPTNQDSALHLEAETTLGHTPNHAATTIHRVLELVKHPYLHR